MIGVPTKGDWLWAWVDVEHSGVRLAQRAWNGFTAPREPVLPRELLRLRSRRSFVRRLWRSGNGIGESAR
jgi:hypothetical protein